MRYKLYQEKPGVISENKIWVFIDTQGYLYSDESLFKLLVIVIKEWQHDRHLVG